MRARTSRHASATGPVSSEKPSESLNQPYDRADSFSATEVDLRQKGMSFGQRRRPASSGGSGRAWSIRLIASMTGSSFHAQARLGGVIGAPVPVTRAPVSEID